MQKIDASKITGLNPNPITAAKLGPNFRLYGYSAEDIKEIINFAKSKGYKK